MAQPTAMPQPGMSQPIISQTAMCEAGSRTEPGANQSWQPTEPPVHKENLFLPEAVRTNCSLPLEYGEILAFYSLLMCVVFFHVFPRIG